MSNVKNQWKYSGGPSGNCVLSYEEFYISYASNPGCGISFFASDDNEPETALCVSKNGDTEFMILNGDFRKEYEELAPQGLTACIEFYKKNKQAQSSWSTEK